MANTSCTHARAHARTHTHTHTHTHAYTLTRTYTRTHSRTRIHPPTAIAVQVVAVRLVSLRPTITKLTPPFRVFRWR